MKANAAIIINPKDIDRSFFGLCLSDKNPAGIDITPYAIKKEKGRSPVRNRLRSKLSLTSEMIELRILVIKEMAKNITNTRRTI